MDIQNCSCYTSQENKKLPKHNQRIDKKFLPQEDNKECKNCSKIYKNREIEIGKTDYLMNENIDCLSDDNESGRLEIDTNDESEEESYEEKKRPKTESARKTKFIYPPHITILQGKPVKYECKICTKKFRSKNMRKYHIYCDKSIPKPKMCDVCGKRFIKKSHLNHHMQTHSIDGPKKCPKCDKSYLHDVDLRLHELEHEENFKFKCQKCDRKFPTKIKLKLHEKIHGENLKNFKCNICDLSFTLKGNLMKHQVIHSGEKHFTCNVCSKKFPRKSALQTHVLIHKTREFQCQECGRAFTDAKNLERHLKVHQTMKEFTCSECGLTGSRKDNLVRHVRNFHPTVTPPSKGVIVQKDLELRHKLRSAAKECVKKKTIVEKEPIVKPPLIDNRVSVIRTVGNVNLIKSEKPVSKPEKPPSPQPVAEVKKVEKKIDQFEIYRRILQPDVDDDDTPNGDDNDYPDFFKRRESKKETTNFNFSKVHWRHKFFIENNMKAMK